MRIIPFLNNMCRRRGRISLTLRFVRNIQSEASEITETPNTVETSIKTDTRALTIQIRNEMFNEEKSRLLQINAPRIEKIKVNHKGYHLGDNVQMLMNKNLSTPYDCAQHVSRTRLDDSVLAFVVPFSSDKESNEANNKDEVETANKQSEGRVWDMHRPLEGDCELQLLQFDMRLGEKWMHEEVNKAYWRSCAMVLGAVANEAFEEDIFVSCAHLPEISINNGAFCYDIELDNCLSSWEVDDSVLITLTKTARKLISNNHKFERIEVKMKFAEDMFQSDPNMLARIHNTPFTNGSRKERVILYRFGKHIDIMDGPLISNTSLLYQFVISAVHRLQSKQEDKLLWRFQGLSLPKKLQVHHAVWSKLEMCSRKLVCQNLPFEIEHIKSHNTKFAKHAYRSLEGKTKKYNINTGQWLEDAWLTDSTKIKV